MLIPCNGGSIGYKFTTDNVSEVMVMSCRDMDHYEIDLGLDEYACVELINKLFIALGVEKHIDSRVDFVIKDNI